jgi:sulfur relay (sulfurtransferase) DsrC/TusE family protein
MYDLEVKNMATQRKSISKSLRFEVFKRDSFTCQYCGKMAPDVVLEVDHINPVKDGGKTDIMNLITSCFDCNRGKGGKKLTDNQVIKQQQEQLKEINERREQLKLMLKWRKELEKLEEEQVDVIENMIHGYSGYGLSDYGRQNMKKCISKFGINEVIESTKISFTQYPHKNNSEVSKAIDYIPKICQSRRLAKENPIYSKIQYIKGIIKNRFGYRNDVRLAITLKQCVLNEEDAQIVMDMAKTADSYRDFMNIVNDYYGI